MLELGHFNFGTAVHRRVSDLNKNEQHYVCKRQWYYLVDLGEQPEFAFVSVLRFTVDMPSRRRNKPCLHLRLCVCGSRSDKACESKGRCLLRVWKDVKARKSCSSSSAVSLSMTGLTILCMLGGANGVVRRGTMGGNGSTPRVRLRGSWATSRCCRGKGSL
jgi:hypothetical protein